MPLAEQLDFEAVALVRDLLWHIADSDRLLRMMGIAARRHPAAHRATEPDRFVANDIGIVGIDDEGAQPQLAALFALGQSRRLADEIRVLAVGDETIEAGFQRPVDRPVFAPP